MLSDLITRHLFNTPVTSLYVWTGVNSPLSVSSLSQEMSADGIPLGFSQRHTDPSSSTWNTHIWHRILQQRARAHARTHTLTEIVWFQINITYRWMTHNGNCVVWSWLGCRWLSESNSVKFYGLCGSLCGLTVFGLHSRFVLWLYSVLKLLGQVSCICVPDVWEEEAPLLVSCCFRGWLADVECWDFSKSINDMNN